MYHLISVFNRSHCKHVTADREEGRLRNEMKRIQNDLNELDNRRNIAEVYLIFSIHLIFTSTWRKNPRVNRYAVV